MNIKDQETKEIENQPRLKDSNLKIILTCNQCAKKVMSGSLGLVDFAIRQVNPDSS